MASGIFDSNTISSLTGGSIMVADKILSTNRRTIFFLVLLLLLLLLLLLKAALVFVKDVVHSKLFGIKALLSTRNHWFIGK